MAIKILNGALILFAIFMGLKQGYAMLAGKPEMLGLFGKWGLGQTSVAVLGATTMLGALMILWPRTFVWGNLLMAATILLIIAFHLKDQDLKGVAIETPFFLLNLLIIYLQHPLKGD